MRTTRAEINLENLVYNIAAIRKASGNQAMMAMVKANGYGHGIIEISKALRKENIEFLGVAFADEAVALREAGDSGAIAVMTPPEPQNVGLFAKYDLRAVLSSICEVKELSAAAKAAGANIKAHLYIDTGLARDGVRPENLEEFWRESSQIGGITWEGCCTHFATSEDEDTSFAAQQLAVFNDALNYLASQGAAFRYIHAANTGAIAILPEARFNLIRPGYSIYGLLPTDALRLQLPVKPLLSLKSSVLSTRRVPKGTSVSYGRRYITEKETTIATIPVGYGDGYMRNLSGRQDVLIGGKRFLVVGVICMDECMVDTGDFPVTRGDEVVLIGNQGNESITAAELADNCNTIGYEIVTAISGRVPRVYSR